MIFRKSHLQIFKCFFFHGLLMLAGVHCYAQDKTTPGEVRTPYPTILNLAVEWFIEGDDNQNGKVTL